MILIERRPTRGGQSGENPDRERHLRQLGTDSARLFASFLFFRAERTCKLEQELVEMIWARVKSLLRAPSRATQALDALIEGSANEQSILQTQLTSINERLDTIIDKLGTLSSANQLDGFSSLQIRQVARLQRKGFVVAHQFIDQDEVQRLHALVDEVYSMMESAHTLEPEDFHSAFRFWNGVWLDALPVFLASAPSVAREYEEIANLIEDRTGDQLGYQWRFYPFRSFFRRHIGVANKVPWHIDADAADINRRHCINVWLPLDAVGHELPSLEVVPRSHVVMRNLPLLTGENRYRDDEFVDGIGRPYTPVLQAGDALIFDQFTLHRTQCMAHDKELVRTACEFRFEKT